MWDSGEGGGSQMWHIIQSPVPAHTTHSNNVGLVLAHRRRRWANTKPTLFECMLFTGVLADRLGVICFVWVKAPAGSDKRSWKLCENIHWG